MTFLHACVGLLTVYGFETLCQSFLQYASESCVGLLTVYGFETLYNKSNDIQYFISLRRTPYRLRF